MVNILFLLWPFCLYLGIALQGISTYACGLLLPALVLAYRRQPLPLAFKGIGLCLVALHVLFPIINILVYLLPKEKSLEPLYHIVWKWPGIFQSLFPSSLFFIGFLLWAAARISQARQPAHTAPSTASIQPENPLWYFLVGLCLATVLFTALLGYQYATGLDLRSLFRAHLSFLSKDDAFGTLGYRVYGFYGHPLTVAGVCLTNGLFAWTCLCVFNSPQRVLFQKIIPSSWHPHRINAVFLAIAMGCAVGVFLSGGRTASVVLVVFYVAILFWYQVRRNTLVTLLIITLVGLSSYLCWHTQGLWQRFQNTTQAVESTHTFDAGNNRLSFWRTYGALFVNRPLLGQGSYWLKHGVREAFYNKLGYGSLDQKYNAHNIYLEVLGSAGLCGVLWIAFVCRSLWRRLRDLLFRPGNPLGAFQAPFLLCILGNLVHGLTQNVFFDSSVIYSYVGILGALLWQAAYRPHPSSTSVLDDTGI